MSVCSSSSLSQSGHALLAAHVEHVCSYNEEESLHLATLYIHHAPGIREPCSVLKCALHPPPFPCAVIVKANAGHLYHAFSCLLCFASPQDNLRGTDVQKCVPAIGALECMQASCIRLSIKIFGRSPSFLKQWKPHHPQWSCESASGLQKGMVGICLRMLCNCPSAWQILFN